MLIKTIETTGDDGRRLPKTLRGEADKEEVTTTEDA